MQRRILIIDDHNDLAEALEEVFSHIGHFVRIVENRQDALAIEKKDEFDHTSTELDIEGSEAELNLNGDGETCLPDIHDLTPAEHIKAFKLCAPNFGRDDFDEDELKSLIATVLDYKIRFVDK